MSAPRKIAAAYASETRVGLGMFRRIGISLFMHWRGQNPKWAKATLADFHEEMSLEHQRRAFAIVSSKKSAALESS